jgi:hypothetical protein
MLPLHQLVFATLWLGACGYAAVYGGAPERLASGSMFAAVISTMICSFVWRPEAGSYSSLELGVAVTDLTLFAVMTAIALASTRFWPMLMASMLGCGVFGHFAKPLGPDILPKAYYMTVALWGYPTLLLLAVATWRHRARLARYGVDYSWVRELPHRYREGWSIDEVSRPVLQR